MTFNRPENSGNAEDVEVTVSGVAGATATFEEVSSYGLINNKATVTDAILCPNVNRNTNPTIQYLFTIEKLPADFTFNTVGLYVHALALGGATDKYQESEGREWGVTIKADDEDFASNPNIDICKGKVFINTHELRSESPKTTENGTLKLLLILENGTLNTGNGCFFGLESITLSNVTTADVTYHLQYNGKKIATEENVASQIGAAPALPASLARDYCTFVYQDEAGQPVTEITAETTDIYVTATVNEDELPFEFSTSYDEAHWYCMNGQAGYADWFIFTNEDNVKNNYNTSIGNGDKYLWAFIGNPVEGVKVINKAAGPDKYLQSDAAAASTNITMGETHTWTIKKQTQNFTFGTNTFLLYYNETLCFNANQDGNMKLWAGYGNGSTCWVTNPAKATMSVNAEAKWATFIAPFTVTVPEGVTAYTTTGVDEAGAKVLVEPVENGTIPANTPVILYSETEVNETYTGPNTATAATYTNGLLTGVYADTDAPKGTYVLQKHGENVGFYKVDETIPTVGPNRAYLTLSEEAGSEVKAFFLGSDDATGIQAVADAQAEDGAVYNLAGQRVAKTVKGIYVVGGKKVAVK